MEILMTLLNQQPALDLMIFTGGIIGILVLLLVYRIVIAPKIKIRRVLKRVRQLKYEQESRKVAKGNDTTFTWGTFHRHGNMLSAYDVKEFSPVMDTQFNKIMNDLSEEEKTNFS